MKSTTKRINDLQDYEKALIVLEYKSGKYFMKEIMQKHNITQQTIYKVVAEYELRTKTNNL